MTMTYDAWQTTYFFSCEANAVCDTIVKVSLDPTVSKPEALKTAATDAAAELTAQLKTALDTAIGNANKTAPPLLGAADWTIVWGPQVLCIDPEVASVHWAPFYTAKFSAANAVYVAYSQSLNRYIVAIAGTNPISFYDWLSEDFNTATVVPWEGALQVWTGGTNTTPPSTTVPCISQATFTGISNLLGIIDTVITRQTLVAFLAGVAPGGATLTFTGHSLGGALSPTLALACFDPTHGLLKGSQWAVGSAMVYPTGGATPGNAAFAAAFNTAGWGGCNGDQPWQAWNTNLYNNVDVVPHAWGAAMLDLIPAYYATCYDMITTDLIKALVAEARRIAAKGEAVAGSYTPIRNQSLNPTGVAAAADEFIHRTTVDVQGLPVPENLTIPEATAAGGIDQTTVSWTSQAVFQHTTAYGRLILQRPPLTAAQG